MADTIALLLITTSFTIPALVYQTFRVERMSRQLELVYALAKLRGHHAYAEIVGGGVEP